MRQLAIFTILILLSLHVQNQDLTNSVTSSVTNLPVQSTQTPPSISNQNAGTIEQSQQLSPPINNNVFPFSFSIDLNQNAKLDSNSGQQTKDQKNSNLQDNSKITFSFGINPDGTSTNQPGASQSQIGSGTGFSFGMSTTDVNGNKNQFNYQIPQNLPDEVFWVVGGIYFTAFFCVIAFNVTLLYLCLKKRSQRNAIKRRMQEIQAMFAQSQNMNVFEMQTQPNFPQTMHI